MSDTNSPDRCTLFASIRSGFNGFPARQEFLLGLSARSAAHRAWLCEGCSPVSPTWGRPGSWSFLLPSRLQPRGQFPLACLAEHVAQLPDALSVIGHSQAALGLFEFKLDLPDRGVRFAVHLTRPSLLPRRDDCPNYFATDTVTWISDVPLILTIVPVTCRVKASCPSKSGFAV